MVRTIYVVYTNQKLSNSQLKGMKQYMFLCPYDIIQAGDMIEDNRYSTPMQVVSWNRNTAQVQNGITLKVIEPSRLNGAAIYRVNYSEAEQKVLNSMEARNISVTLEQAREWYNSGNTTLRTLALSAYAENELVGYEYMKSCIDKDTVSLVIPHGDSGKVLTSGKLAIIARYLNGSWEMSAGKTGYFIGKSSNNQQIVVTQIDPLHEIAVYEHRTVQYAGIVYFKSVEDAKKAAKMLGADIRYLF
jgi:hypothetical protein|nr:MAG TPA: hypothetical protein [Crassvirales sp.]